MGYSLALSCVKSKCVYIFYLLAIYSTIFRDLRVRHSGPYRIPFVRLPPPTTFFFTFLATTAAPPSG